MGIDLQWDRLAPATNTTGNILAGFEAGDAMRRKTVTQNALALYQTDPEAAVKALMPVDPGTALQLRGVARQDRTDAARTKAADQYGSGDVAGATQTAIGAGDFDMARQIAALTKEQRDVAKQHAEELGSYAYSLKGLPYEQAKARIAADTPMLLKRGFKSEEIASFDPTPQNIDVVVGQAMDLKTALDHADKSADNQRADQTAAEVARHNREAEKVARQNAGTSAYSAQTGRMSFNERKKAGGFGTPGASAGTWEPLD